MRAQQLLINYKKKINKGVYNRKCRRGCTGAASKAVPRVAKRIELACPIIEYVVVLGVPTEGGVHFVEDRCGLGTVAHRLSRVVGLGVLAHVAIPDLSFLVPEPLHSTVSCNSGCLGNTYSMVIVGIKRAYFLYVRIRVIVQRARS